MELQGMLALKDLYHWVNDIILGTEMCPNFFSSSESFRRTKDLKLVHTDLKLVHTQNSF